MVELNGRLTPAGEASVSIFDPGFLHGASVYTTMLAHQGVVFRFERHLERLAETIRLLGLKVDATTGGLVKGMYRVLDANGLTEARCRITLTPGPPATENRPLAPTTLITAEPLPDYPAAWYDKGIGVVVTALKQHTGDPTFGYKTGCYLPRLLARQEAAAKGADDALWYTADNRLAESCASNVFLVRGGEVFTPPRDTPVLPGVVREAVLELCGRLEIPAHDDRPLTVHDMLAADEMFLTSSCMGIRPVARVERHAVGEEKPGPVTRRIMQAYRELLDEECEHRQNVTSKDLEQGVEPCR
jgi:branched-chain amino acid aminotransferase